MLDRITILISVSTSDEWLDDYPTQLRVIITEELRQWIIKMSKLVKKNDLDHVAKYNWEPEYLKEDENGNFIPYESGTENEKITVRDADFYWSGLIKHTDYRYSSDNIYLEELNKYFSYLTKPLEEMPKYLNDADETIKLIAKERMEKGE